MEKRTGMLLLGLSATFITVPFVAREAGIRVNTTDSAPLGIWITRDHQARGVQGGDMVSICPPDVPVVRAMVAVRPLYRGDCTSGAVDLLKPVAAVYGDTVTIGKGNVTVNGITLPNTLPREKALAFPEGEYTVAKTEVWVFSTYASDSFDSRYFGPVPSKNIRGFAEPLIVDGNPQDMIRRNQ